MREEKINVVDGCDVGIQILILMNTLPLLLFGNLFKRSTELLFFWDFSAQSPSVFEETSERKHTVNRNWH